MHLGFLYASAVWPLGTSQQVKNSALSWCRTASLCKVTFWTRVFLRSLNISDIWAFPTSASAFPPVFLSLLRFLSQHVFSCLDSFFFFLLGLSLFRRYIFSPLNTPPNSRSLRWTAAIVLRGPCRISLHGPRKVNFHRCITNAAIKIREAILAD